MGLSSLFFLFWWGRRGGGRGGVGRAGGWGAELVMHLCWVKVLPGVLPGVVSQSKLFWVRGSVPTVPMPKTTLPSTPKPSTLKKTSSPQSPNPPPPPQKKKKKNCNLRPKTTLLNKSAPRTLHASWAQASLTIDGIFFVVDPGMAKVLNIHGNPLKTR